MITKPPLQVVSPGSSTSARRSVRILIADDDRDNANMLAAVLREEGHEIGVSLRGDEALELSRLFRPDVVIADVNMPGSSGYAIARELKERHGNLAPLLIAMTGVWTGNADEKLGRASGFDHYLVKPCELKELLRLIDSFQRMSSGKGSASA
jgi:two-component system, OmpR family, response regulator